MNQNPRISVIVPVYNVEQYLPRCVESILAQTYENLEILLVDDGTKDNSLRGALGRQQRDRGEDAGAVPAKRGGHFRGRAGAPDFPLGEHRLRRMGQAVP